MTSTLLDRLSATINHTLQLFIHNDTIAKQAAHDWQTSMCEVHHIPRFRDIAKVQQGLNEPDCWTCHLCEIERKRAALAEPKPLPLSAFANYSPGSVLLAINAKEQEYKRTMIKQIAAARISTTPLAARDIEYANTPLDNDETIPRLKAISRSTKQIPAVKAEVAILELMRGSVSPHDTGEQEKLPTKIEEDAFLL